MNIGGHVPPLLGHLVFLQQDILRQSGVLKASFYRKMAEISEKSVIFRRKKTPLACACLDRETD